MDSPLLSRSPPSPHKIEERDSAPAPNSSPSSDSILTTAAIILFVYFFLVMSVYLFNSEGYSGIKTSPAVDALYVSIITLCRIGYGDITPLTPVTKAFSCIFVLVGLGIIRAVLSRAVFQLLDVQMRFMLAIARSRPCLGHYLFDLKKGRMYTYIKVIFAFGVLVIYIGVGALALYRFEELDLIDSFYVSVISVTTTGYGNPGFKTLSGRLFASFWLLVSTLAVASIFLFFTEARTGKSHERIARKLTVKDLSTADNNRNFVSKSESTS